jgi:hypothetical protein
MNSNKALSLLTPEDHTQNDAYKSFNDKGIRIVIPLKTSKKMIPWYGLDIRQALLNIIMMMNKLFLEPDVERTEENYKHYSSLLARFLHLRTKSHWPEMHPDMCNRFAQIKNRTNEFSMVAIFWKSEKHEQAGERPLFSFTVTMKPSYMLLTNLQTERTFTKAVLHTTESAVIARANDAARRKRQRSGTLVQRVLLPCLPKRSFSMMMDEYMQLPDKDKQQDTEEPDNICMDGFNVEEPPPYFKIVEEMMHTFLDMDLEKKGF